MSVIYEAKLVFNRVVMEERAYPLDTPKEIMRYMEGAFDEDPTVEWVYVIPVNQRLYPKGRVLVSRGAYDRALVNPAQVIRPVLLASVPYAILVHNHPSGDPSASSTDHNLTRDIREAFRTMSMRLVEHLVIGDKSIDPVGKGYYSFWESGFLPS